MNPQLFASRRAWLRQTACGFGGLAAAGWLIKLGRRPGEAIHSAFSTPSQTHHLPLHARRRQPGRLVRLQGNAAKTGREMHGFDDARILANKGERGTSQRIMNSPWKFRPYGETGRMVSELFPCVAEHVDRLCFLHGMHTEGVAHGPSTLFLHCGSTNFIRPSFGSWLLYGLGTENENLPGFVSISPLSAMADLAITEVLFCPLFIKGLPSVRPIHLPKN